MPVHGLPTHGGAGLAQVRFDGRVCVRRPRGDIPLQCRPGQDNGLHGLPARCKIGCFGCFIQPVDPLQQCRQGLRHVGLSRRSCRSGRQQFGSLVNFSRNVGKGRLHRTHVERRLGGSVGKVVDSFFQRQVRRRLLGAHAIFQCRPVGLQFEHLARDHRRILRFGRLDPLRGMQGHGSNLVAEPVVLRLHSRPRQEHQGQGQK